MKDMESVGIEKTPGMKIAKEAKDRNI